MAKSIIPGNGYLATRRGIATKKHRKIRHDNIMGVTKPNIRKMARRGGIKRISRDIYADIRDVIKERLNEIMKQLVNIAELTTRKTIMVSDVMFVLNRMGSTIYGFHPVYPNKTTDFQGSYTSSARPRLQPAYRPAAASSRPLKTSRAPAPITSRAVQSSSSTNKAPTASRTVPTKTSAEPSSVSQTAAPMPPLGPRTPASRPMPQQRVKSESRSVRATSAKNEQSYRRRSHAQGNEVPETPQARRHKDALQGEENDDDRTTPATMTGEEVAEARRSKRVFEQAKANEAEANEAIVGRFLARR